MSEVPLYTCIKGFGRGGTVGVVRRVVVVVGVVVDRRRAVKPVVLRRGVGV